MQSTERKLAYEQALCLGKGVKKSRGEGRERVRACRQTLSPNREPVHRLKESQKPEAQGLSSKLSSSIFMLIISW